MGDFQARRGKEFIIDLRAGKWAVFLAQGRFILGRCHSAIWENSSAQMAVSRSPVPCSMDGVEHISTRFDPRPRRRVVSEYVEDGPSG